MMNPQTGANNLMAADGLTDRLKFVANTAQELTAHHAACASCNVHVLADDPSLVQKCPACTADLSFDETPERQSAIASGASFTEAVAAYVDTLSAVTEPTAVLSGDCLVAVAGAATFDAYTGRPAVRVNTEGAYKAVAATTAGEDLEAHYFVCASACDTPYVVSSDDMPVFCPACAGSLLEPEADDLAELDGNNAIITAVASDDDDYEDDDEDDLSDFDDEGDDDEDDFEDDDEDEDDFEGTASSDDDDSDDEDDEDYSDDEDDEDSDEDDSDDEDDEDGLSLSLASAHPTRIRARNRATASSYQDTAMVPASFLAIASNKEGALDKFQVVYAGNVQGENTWYATIDRVPVAMAVASQTKHPDVFNKDVFAVVVANVAEAEGIPAAMEQFGFNEIKPEIEVGEHVSQEIRSAVDEQVGDMREEMAEEKSELNQRVAAALAIAASGINRGFFTDLSNPVITTLVESLASAGIVNADAMVAKAFSENSDAYHRTLLEKAQEIMTYDKTVQNQLAQAVTECGYTAQASSYGVLGRTVQQPKEQPRVVATASAACDDDFKARMTQALRF